MLGNTFSRRTTRPRTQVHHETITLITCMGFFLASAFAATGCKSGGCSKDSDCKGDRICQDGECVPSLLPTKPGANVNGGSDPARVASSSAQRS